MALLYTGQQWGVILGILALGIALKAALVVWLHRDVRAAGRDAWSWTAAGVFAFIPTVIVWRVKRPRPVEPTPPPRAPAAEEPVSSSSDPDPFRVGLRTPVTREAPEPGAVRAALADQAPRPTATESKRVSCPRCAAVFEAERSDEGRATCPSCGATGRP